MNEIILRLNILSIAVELVILGQGNNVLVVAVNNNSAKPWI
jgi:hypothetical protein